MENTQNSNEDRDHQTLPRNLDIQVLRGIAVSLVLIFHAGFSGINGYIGVDLFFVISGFVITQNLAREHRQSGRIRFSRFYVARARRLIPPLMYMLIFTLVFSNLLQSMNGQLQNTFKTYIGSLLYIPNLILARITSGYFGVDANQNPLLHTWSLGVEEQFYLVFPVLLFVLLKIVGNKSKLLLPIISLLTASSYCIQFIIPKYISIPFIMQDNFYSPFSRFWEFLIGTIAYFLVSAPTRVLKKNKLGIYRFLGIISLTLISIILIVPRNLIPNHLSLLISCVACAFLIYISEIILRISPAQSKVNPIKRILVNLGNASYSIYLWHWPLVVFSKLIWPTSNTAPILATLFSLIPAYLSYKLIEFRRYQNHHRTAAKLRFTIVSVASASFIIYPTYIGINHGWGQGWALTSHIAMQHDCDKPPLKLDECTFGNKSSKNRVIIAGDSQAWASADGVIGSLANRDASVMVASHNNCPFVRDQRLVVGEECADWNLNISKLIEKGGYSYLIVSNSLSYSGLDLNEISNLLNKFESISIKTIFVLPPPGGDSTSSTRSILLRHGSATRFGINGSQDRNIELKKNITSNSPNTYLLDPADYLCMNLKCKIAENGVEYYTDGNHLSINGANLLASKLRTLIRF